MIGGIMVLMLSLCIYLMANIKLAFPIWLYIAIFPYRNLIMGKFPWLDTCVDFVLLIGFLYSLIEGFINKSVKKSFPKEIFFFVAGLSSLTLIYATISNKPWFIYRTTDFRFYIGVLLLSCYMNLDIDSYNKVKDVCDIFVINSLIMAICGAVRYFKGDINRLYAFVHTNMSGAYFVIALLCCYLILILSMQKIVKANKGLYYFIILVNLFAIILNHSSAALLGLIFGFGAGGFILLKIERKVWVACIAFLLLFGVICIFVTVKGDAMNVPIIRMLMARKGYFDTTRIYIWQDAIQQWKEHPFIGIGADNFRDSITGYHYVTHNDYLTYLVNYGLIGLILFGIYSLNVFNAILTRRNYEVMGICIALFGAMYIFMLSHNFVNWIIFWVIAQMIFCIKNLDNKEKRMETNETQTK